MSGHDDELEQVRVAVNCVTVLELAAGWKPDKPESTCRALKYRGSLGEIVILNHDGEEMVGPR